MLEMDLKKGMTDDDSPELTKFLQADTKKLADEETTPAVGEVTSHG